MTFFEDLARCTYFTGHPELIAVGWLDDKHSFRSGRIEPRLFETLAALLMDPWQPFVVAGVHDCELCRFSGGPGVVRVGDSRIYVGSTNLFVPHGDAVFIAPSLILHYVDAHD